MPWTEHDLQHLHFDPNDHNHNTRLKARLNDADDNATAVRRAVNQATFVRQLQRRPARTRTQQQRDKDRVAKRMDNAWRITRRRKLGSGIENDTGVACYQNSVIISLCHLPKFVNWIRSHNVTKDNGNIDWLCDEESIPAGERCAACVLKDFVNLYWGNDGANALTIPQAGQQANQAGANAPHVHQAAADFRLLSHQAMDEGREEDEDEDDVYHYQHDAEELFLQLWTRLRDSLGLAL